MARKTPPSRARSRWRCLPELIGFISATAVFLALSVAPRVGLSQSTNTTVTTSTTQSSHITAVPGGGIETLGLPYLSLASVQAALQRLGAITLSQTLVQTGTNTSITTTTTFGPATILIGTDQSTTFFVAPGTTNVNVNTHTATFFDATSNAAFSAPGRMNTPVTASAPADDLCTK